MNSHHCHHQHKNEHSQDDARQAKLYSCPMHPEVESNEPGNCPKCGMALEPHYIEANSENAELSNMTHRLWVSLFFGVPVFVISMINDMSPRFAHPILPSGS